MAREEAGLQQQELAKSAGISNALLSMMENRYEGKDSTRQRLAAVLGKYPADVWPDLYERPTVPIVGGPLDGKLSTETNTSVAIVHCETVDGDVLSHLYLLEGDVDEQCWVYQGALPRPGEGAA